MEISENQANIPENIEEHAIENQQNIEESFD